MFGKLEPEKVYIFFGKMGSGKTVNAVHEIARFHRAGLPVWVNFPLMGYPTIKKGEHQPIYFAEDPEDILAMEGGLFVIDEAYRKLNARNWKDLSEAAFLGFTHCRKLHMTIIVIAQSWKRIDLSIRELATKARGFEGPSFFGHRYPYIEYDIDEAGDIVKYRDPSLERIAEEQGGSSWIKKATYGLYDTDHLFDTIKRKKEWPTAIRALPLQESGSEEHEETAGEAEAEMAQAERIAPIISASALECAEPVESPPGAGA